MWYSELAVTDNQASATTIATTMSEYEPNDVKATESSGQSPECTEDLTNQSTLQNQLRSEHENRVEELKQGNIDVEDLDTVPLYDPTLWDSYEQYEEIVGNPLVTPDPEGI